MKISAEKLTEESLFRKACEATLRPGMRSKLSLRQMFQCEHSPIRTLKYWVQLSGLMTFVSVHFVRHKFGIEHYVQTQRDDRGGVDGQKITRESPVQHSMDFNAQAAINISRKRLCLKSHPKTFKAWKEVCRELAQIEPELADFLVPECVYRNGLCPELKPCKAGPAAVCAAYKPWPGTRG